MFSGPAVMGTLLWAFICKLPLLRDSLTSVPFHGLDGGSCQKEPGVCAACSFLHWDDVPRAIVLSGLLCIPSPSVLPCLWEEFNIRAVARLDGAHL